jgi:hypothetical protein
VILPTNGELLTDTWLPIAKPQAITRLKIGAPVSILPQVPKHPLPHNQNL